MEEEMCITRLEDMKQINSTKSLTREEIHAIIMYAQEQAKRVEELEELISS